MDKDYHTRPGPPTLRPAGNDAWLAHERAAKPRMLEPALPGDPRTRRVAEPPIYNGTRSRHPGTRTTITSDPAPPPADALAPIPTTCESTIVHDTQPEHQKWPVIHAYTRAEALGRRPRDVTSTGREAGFKVPLLTAAAECIEWPSRTPSRAAPTKILRRVPRRFTRTLVTRRQNQVIFQPTSCRGRGDELVIGGDNHESPPSCFPRTPRQSPSAARQPNVKGDRANPPRVHAQRPAETSPQDGAGPKRERRASPREVIVHEQETE